MSASAVQGVGDELLGGLLDLGQVLGSLEGLGVDLVHVLRARRARGEPRAVRRHLQATDGRVVTGSAHQLRDDRIPRQLGRRHVVGGQGGELRLLLAGGSRVDAGVGGGAEALHLLGVQLRRRLAGHREDLRGEQRQDNAVLVGRPHRAVLAQERGPRALLAAEADGAGEQAGDEVLEAHRHLDQVASHGGHDAVDERGGDQGLTNGCLGTPARAVREQILDGDGQEVIRVHQTVGRDDAVPIRVRVVAGRDVVGSVALRVRGHRLAQRRHRVRGGTIHADLAVPVQRHERPRRIDLGVDDGEVQAVALTDGRPVVDGRAAQRIGADAHAGRPDRINVDDLVQLRHVVIQVVEGGDVRIVEQIGAGDAGNVLPLPGVEELVGARRDPAGRVGVGRPAVRRIVLEAAVARRVVARGDDDAVGQAIPGGAQSGGRAVSTQDGDRDRGGRRVGAARVDARVDARRCKDLQGGAPRGFAQGVRVATDEQGAVDSLGSAVLDDRGGDGDDVGLVELAVQRGSAVTRGAEGDALTDVGRVGRDVVVGGDDIVDVDEVFR